MAETRLRHEWARTSSLMALIESCHSGKQVSPSKHDPFAKAAKPIPVGIGVLKDVFIARRMPKEAE
jgi:hypothetical protein